MKLMFISHPTEIPLFIFLNRYLASNYIYNGFNLHKWLQSDNDDDDDFDDDSVNPVFFF